LHRQIYIHIKFDAIMSLLGFRIMHNHVPYISLTPIFNIVCIFLMCSQYFERDTVLKGDQKSTRDKQIFMEILKITARRTIVSIQHHRLAANCCWCNFAYRCSNMDIITVKIM
jgi:hypothetical protein